jgi:tripartite-type tricarboxylate transporter receptor subunit TctC
MQGVRRRRAEQLAFDQDQFRAGTPVEIIDKLNLEINAALADPKLKARLAELGGAALPGSPADFARLIAEETEKWRTVVQAANIKPE